MTKSRKRVCRFIIWILFFILLFLQFPVKGYAEEFTFDPEKLHAVSAVLMDAKTGRVLFSKEGEVMRPMASTTKILTCIIALENGNLEDRVVVSKKAASQPAVHLKMKEGQTFYLKDLLYSLMLESHNDTAVAIAEHIGGSVEGFARLMNDKAKELGCENSYFITPNGLDAENENGIHSISATDLSTIMSYCLMHSPKASQFIEITRTNSYAFTDESGNYSYSCQNHNTFLNMMEGALSGKTGYTGGAGYCYVGALERDRRMFVVSLLGSGWPNHKNYKWEDTRKLMEYAIENYHDTEIAIVSDLPEVSVEYGYFDSVTVPVQIDTEKDSFSILVREDENIHAQVEIVNSLNVPVLQGEDVGKITYYVDDEIIKEYKIITGESVSRITFINICTKIMKKMLVCDIID